VGKARHKKVPPQFHTRCHGINPGRAAGLVLAGMSLATVMVAGCAGTVANAPVPNPPQQTYRISGTIAPAANSSGATVTLGGATSKTATADMSGNYVFTGLASGVYVVAPSKSGFTFSPGSQSVTVSTADATAVDFSAAVLQAHSATLSWTASTATVAGYDIYRGTVAGGPYVLLNSSPVNGVTYTDTTTASGQTYFYVTTAVDNSGNQSVYSNEVQVVIP
jgi:hypothetical protein